VNLSEKFVNDLVGVNYFWIIFNW